MGKHLTELEERQFKFLMREFERRVEGGELGLELALMQLEEIIGVSRQDYLKHEGVVGERAQASCRWFELWYQTLGFDVVVPVPHIKDEEFIRRHKMHQALFYRPPTTQVSFKAFMIAVGRSQDWANKNYGGDDVLWEPTELGYWFWADVAPNVPHRGDSWINLTFQFKLLSLEEYVIVWWAQKSCGKGDLDKRTACWLRTRRGKEILLASSTEVQSYSRVLLITPSIAHAGARTMEVVSPKP